MFRYLGLPLAKSPFLSQSDWDENINPGKIVWQKTDQLSLAVRHGGLLQNDVMRPGKKDSKNTKNLSLTVFAYNTYVRYTHERIF